MYQTPSAKRGLSRLTETSKSKPAGVRIQWRRPTIGAHRLDPSGSSTLSAMNRSACAYSSGWGGTPVDASRNSARRPCPSCAALHSTNELDLFYGSRPPANVPEPAGGKPFSAAVRLESVGRSVGRSQDGGAGEQAVTSSRGWMSGDCQFCRRTFERALYGCVGGLPAGGVDQPWRTDWFGVLRLLALEREGQAGHEEG